MRRPSTPGAPPDSDGPVLITTEDERAVTVLTVRGDIDVTTAGRLRTAALDVIDAGARRVVFDLSQLGFLGSSGLGVLIGAQRRLVVRRGTTVLVITQDRLTRLLQVTGLDRVFFVYTDLDAALASLGSPSDG